MKILITDVSETWQKDYLVSRLTGHEVFVEPGVLSLEMVNKYPETEILVVFVNNPVTAEVIAALPGLKLIATRSTGYDHIDIAAAKAKNIPVCTVPFYGENTVAEHAFSLILALARKLPQSFARIEDGKFDYAGLRGWDLKGKTLGVIGGGHIGVHVARMAVGFEMEVLVFDLHPDLELAQKIGFNYVDIDNLYAKSDVISLHLPLNEHTTHIINTDSIAKMKNGVYLINTARGGLIDTAALLEGLRSGKISGAGLDVLEGEDFLKEEINLIGNPSYKDQLLTLLTDHVLMEMENVIITPHNAFNSSEALTRILQTTVENIDAFEQGAPQNLVS